MDTGRSRAPSGGDHGAPCQLIQVSGYLIAQTVFTSTFADGYWQQNT